ncbi:MAG: signal recognition particle-docking protein FtsY [Candidatus Altiarchaeales archaeon IMC4]|nr:MAG: signal recognition particle-docking protein FtsY [Candidatus Altiarchaeales archaeon IMC4]
MFGALKKKFDAFIGRVEEKAEEEIEKEESEEIVVETPPTEKRKPQEPKAETKISATTKIKSLFRSTVRLSQSDLDDIIWDLNLDLIQNDVAVETADHIQSELKNRLTGVDIEKGKIDDYIKNALAAVLAETLTPESELDLLEFVKSHPKPVTLVFFGVNGTGKTTTIAKAARFFMDNGFKTVFAAGDTFRAGAIEQLSKHGENLAVNMIKHQKGADAAAVIYDAVKHAKAKGIDIVLADTAGRMQTNVNLMEEMKKIIRVNKPHLKLFVGDSLTGNDAVEQARKFNEAVGIDGIILTKMDADAKGGCALSIAHETGKPILLVGMGQGYGDLKKFDRDWFVRQII